MRRAVFSFTLGSLTIASALLFGCASQDSTVQVGTNTSWLMACESTAECNGVGSCRCGICTDTCSRDEQCGTGICGSELATNSQCEAVTATRLCLPVVAADAQNSCTVLPITGDDELQPVEYTCATPDALLCESFDAPLPEAYSTWYGDEITGSIQDCEVARGAGALRLQSSSFGFSQTRMFLPSPISEGELHVRLFAYFGGTFEMPQYTGLFELWTTDSGPPKIGLDAIGNDQIEVNFSPFSSVFVSSNGVLRRNEWLCLELALELRADSGSVSLSIDGVPVIEESGVVTYPGEPFTVAVIEALPAPDSTGVDVALDELVIATAPIGCD